MKLLLVFLVFLGSGSVQAAENYQDWRQKAEEKLRSEKNWLSVVGLHWLKEGKNALGSDFKNDLRLPKSAPASIGYVQKKGDNYTLHIENKTGLKIDGQSPQSDTVSLKTDADGAPTKLEQGTVEFFLITRKNGTGLRVKDPNSEARKNFAGRNWYPVKKEYVIEGQWAVFRAPKLIVIPDILGNQNEELVSGAIVFKHKGKNYSLYPTQEGDELFIVFKDATSGKTTYGNARFLYASIRKDGKVILDFNKAVNPPCAFTDYATCPKAPKENILDFPIEAGELPPKKS